MLSWRYAPSDDSNTYGFFQVDDFKAFLASGEGGAGRWERRIQPAMRRIVVAAMKTVVDSVHHR